ncbi:MAG: LytR C-terminal domain-containing protein [Microgenomates group bacterium]
MPKEEPKKKVVVVEEVEAVEETPKQEEVAPVEIKDTEKEEVVEQINQVDPAEDYDRPNYLWIIVPTALLVGALVGGLITYFSGLSRLEGNEPTVTPVATAISEVKETPVASTTPTVKRDGLKVQVLNGSGVSGAAGKAKTLLEGLGYTSVDTGNASSSDFANTEVAVKESAKEYLDLVIKDLSKEYEATAAAKVLPTSSKYDIVITLGKK